MTSIHTEAKRKSRLVGKQFGYLTVIRRYAGGGRLIGDVTWECRCKCGMETVVLSSNLVTGNTKSCGRASGKWCRYSGVGADYTPSKRYSAEHRRKQSDAKKRMYARMSASERIAYRHGNRAGSVQD